MANQHPRRYRFIPTRVGNIVHYRGRPPEGPVHPHARGEHRNMPAHTVVGPGSSPRAWGTYLPPIVINYDIRFIPTRVGNIYRIAWDTYAARFIPTRVGNIVQRIYGKDARSVHPHARGEHTLLFRRPRIAHGSSPRAWGTLAAKVMSLVGNRFIPTRVGNIPTIPPGPRLERFIPTRVGNIMVSEENQGRATVHPHARGEHMSSERKGQC